MPRTKRPRRNGSKMKGAVPWALAEGLFAGGSTFIATLIVARILSPTDFGLAAIAVAVAAIIQVILFGGMLEALVRTRHVYPSLSDQVFWVLLGLGIFGSALCWLLAWPLARTYDQPILFWLIGIQGLECITAALVQFPTALLTRKLRTRSLALRMLGFKAVSIAVTVGVAFGGGGAWSLVLGSLIGSVASVILLWRTQTRLPRLPRFDARLKPIMKMASLIMVERGLVALTARGFILLFGKYHGMQALGFMNFAIRIVDEIGSVLTTMLNRLALSFFVTIDRAQRDLAAAWALGSHGIVLLAAPLFFGMAAVAPDLVRVVFGERWLGAVPALQLLALFWGIRLTRSLAPALMRTVGVQGPLVFNAAAAAVLTIVALILTQDSVFAVAAAAYGARLLVTLPAGITTLSRRAGVSVRLQFSAVAFPFLSAAAMAGAVMYARELLVPYLDVGPRLVVLVCFGAALYGLLVLLFDHKKILALAALR